MANDRIVKTNPDSPEPSLIDKACEYLTNGRLVVAPTETRYGLLARVDNPGAVEALFEAKGRKRGKPSAVFVSGMVQLREYAIIGPVEEKLAGEFLPGPLTLVLPTKKEMGDFFTSGRKTGFRISSFPLIKAIMQRLGVPVTATSANVSGQPDCLTAQEAFQVFGEQAALYIDAGILNNPVSTVVEIVNGSARILREGAVSSERILAAVKK